MPGDKEPLLDNLRKAIDGLEVLRRQLCAGLEGWAGLVHDAASTLEQVRGHLQAAQSGLGVAIDRRLGTRKVRRILVVEDDMDERDLMLRLFRRAGFEVSAAADGIDALDQLQSGDPPDVVFLDMVMPRCDGPATLRAIRQEPRYAGLKVFALSGYPRERFNLPQGPEGFDQWFQKPVDSDALLSEVVSGQ